MNKILWGCWFQGINDSSIPFLNKKCIEKWIYFNPDWSINFLSNETIANYVPEYFSILENSPYRSFQARSDLLRILLLSKFGGIWIDLSVLPMLPLNKFYKKILNETDFFAYRFTPRLRRKEICSWFLAAKSPDNYLIKVWKKDFVKAFKNNKDWPYFTFHHTLTSLYDSDPKVKNTIDKMIQIDEKVPHSALMSGWKNKLDSFVYKRPTPYGKKKFLRVNKK